MLAELRIKNFALIDELHLSFQPGFTVLTGETGAGKSLLIDAISLLVGGRGSSEQIRSGAEEAQLEASFHLLHEHPVLRRLRTSGVIADGDSDLVLKRVLSRTGRHRIYLNGSLCPLRTLEDLGGTLVDIHGQHEQQSLLSPASQIEAVDAFGSLERLRDEYESAYRQWKSRLAELESITRAAADRGQREDFLRFQLQEIEQAGLNPDEDAGLHAERQRLLHAHRLRELAEEAHGELQGDEQGVLSRLGRLGRLLADLTKTDPSMADSVDPVTGAAIQLKELAGRLRLYADRMDADPARQNEVEGRLDLIQRLKKKYGGTIEAILAAGDRAKTEVRAIEESDSRSAEGAAAVREAFQRVQEFAQRLSKKRKDAAKRLSESVGAELAALKMEQALFEVLVSKEGEPEEFGPTGADRVEFMLAGNAGEPPKPLARVASGGELSRIMLALKTVLAERDQVPVLVFDEIDTGVGGAAAATMGMRLRKLGSYHQVFCITHLAQVASQAEHHFLVSKGTDNRRTSTWAAPLDGKGREDEIARMLGGTTLTKKIRETAAELLAGAGRGVRDIRRQA
ncbi:DNA repair protein RecN [Nitrospira japonica]|uniref:DNA repair protein RecN n=1 Tax=Nitrospira japonica TaxID=1325564 RepID=A0A1W1I7C2_9BACT|nr:DNA repair protein RecN [Nitrospira japonica]SLM48821.1 DNA repair protein RecN [Nitrospira japonica]